MLTTDALLKQAGGKGIKPVHAACGILYFSNSTKIDDGKATQSDRPTHHKHKVVRHTAQTYCRSLSLSQCACMHECVSNAIASMPAQDLVHNTRHTAPQQLTPHWVNIRTHVCRYTETLHILAI